MPIRSTLARRRARYTGEPAALARRGVGRDKTHGLDTCDAEQFDLRALLFYFAFTPGCWNLSRMLVYTWAPSPQHDMFVMANVETPENLAQTLGVRQGKRPGLPGLRLLPDAGTGDYDFEHVPTGGRLRILTIGERWYRDYVAPDLGPLRDDESAALAAVPFMSHDTKRLFAAMLARCSCRSRDRRWEVGQFFYAEDRDFPAQGGIPATNSFELTGSGDQWQLQWSLFTAPETFTRPLLTAGIELPGVDVTVKVSGRVSVVRFGSATLRLVCQ